MIPERRTQNVYEPERRQPESNRRVERWVAGGIGGTSGMVAIMGLLLNMGFEKDWKVLAIALAANLAITLGTVCFWDVRWYLGQILRVKFGLPPRPTEEEK